VRLTKHDPEDERDRQHHADQERNGADDPELERNRRRLFPPASGQAREAIEARSASFLHERLVPPLESG
jgi:hypothetical protein